MAINPHDDYESLAKLLYPSIEASGNVYYGQTRKLAIDELFDKNNNGFESYFCSCRKEDDNSQYEQHFHWKLGPFSDTVKIVDDNNEYKKYPLAWLKYRLIKRESNNSSIINNASYNIYDVEYNLVDEPTLHCPLDGTLPNGSMYNNSNFFLNEEYDGLYLYVLLYKAPVYEDMDKPLYIEALTDDVTICLIPSETEWSEEHLEQFKYKYCFENNSQPEDLTLNVEIVLGKGSRVYFKCEDRPEFSNTEYLRFEITSDNPEAKVAVGGNIESMAKFEDSKMLSHAYNGLFSDNSLITDASKLYIGKLSDHGCMYLFTGCSRLSAAPVILPCLELDNYCYYSMFQECTNLNNMPILPAKTGAQSCYAFVFFVSSLNGETLYCDIEIRCLLNPNDVDKSVNLWLNGRAGITLYVLQGSRWGYENENVLPEDCTLDEFGSITSEFYYSTLVSDVPIEKYLITHGTNNSNNGRGDITNPYTLSRMEKSFDENGTHPMNTYNADGSFNQEIWGYKSFCSPVQFRNGVYGEDWSIYTFTYNVGASIRGRYVVVSQDFDASASIQIYKSNNADSNERSIILSSDKQVMDYLDSDSAIVEVKRNSDDDTRITLQANDIRLNGDTHVGNLDILSVHDTIDLGYGIVFDVDGSTFKSAENNDLKIDLLKSKFVGDIDDLQISNKEQILFSVPLHGYTNSEKLVSCQAELTSTSDYEYTYEENDEQHTVQRAVTSTISSETEGAYAKSLIEAEVDFGKNLTSAHALVEAIISDNEPTLELSVLDTTAGAYYNNSLTISKSGSSFSGDPVTAEKWGLSDVIAKTLCGIGHTSNGTECVKYGDIGTIGLFYTTYNNQAEGTAGFIIDGENLHPVSIELEATALKAYPHMNKEMEGAWASLTPSTNDSNIILAIRIE